ncbi:hypothetical protein Pyn_16598 [Prunus yedoensis var. nudiflora]|uniref:Uncharacterized protein n=1 Tax=Prunus yedoensis var. nudiflora TaxID=2094558 RepID=A0A314U5X8_PRUYE|nr:hypothetical protein Pyn_16598 [Prunus yedoensis var. nudiflora]
MSGTKRHANRKAEELEKLCSARFALYLTIQKVIFQSGQRTRPRPEKASSSSKKCKNPIRHHAVNVKGKRRGMRRKRLKLDKFSRALEDNINSSFTRKTKTIQPYGNTAKEDHGEESMAELLQPNSYNFHDDNIKFCYGFDSNGIYGNVNLELGYNGDFELVELENFGGVDNYNEPGNNLNLLIAEMIVFYNKS